ncbi:MAG: hypothetical protein R3C59_01805 [Planctomycetaceae bacterium]
MSQTTLSASLSDLSTSSTESARSAWSNRAQIDEFDYAPVSPWGPVAVVLGIGSLTGLTNSVFGLGLAFVGVVVGIVAFFRIRASSGAVRGTGFAATGMVMALLCLTLGSVKLANAYETECPEGFLRVNFPNEISKKEFVYYGGGARRLHPDVAKFIGQKVFLKGFMWQTQYDEGLTSFVLLKDNGECCFGGKPKPFDMMVVHMAEGTSTRAYNGMVAVAGILNANVKAGEEEPVYTLDETVLVEEARTSF